MTLGNIVGNENFGIFGQEQTSIDAIIGIIDLYTDESHNLPVTKTKYPVEDGSSRTDNFVAEPESLVLKGVVSNLQPFLDGIISIPNEARAKEAWGRIKEMKNSGELVSVVTALGLYENMLVTGVDATVNRDTGSSLFFTINLEETLIAQTEIVKLAPVKLSGDAATKGTDTEGGQKQSEEPDEERTSVLKQIAIGLGGYSE